MAESELNSIPPKTRLTYLDYLALPDDGNRYEIIEGELFVSPAPVPRHQKISLRMASKLFAFFEEGGQGEVFEAPIDVALNPETVVQPDIIFIRRENSGIVGERNIEGAPDLIVEILSPSTRRKDVVIKSRVYARFGVPQYWIVDPQRNRIETFRLQGNAYESTAIASSPEMFEPPGFPGLRLSLEDIFA